MVDPWPFDDAENTAVFTSVKILDAADWIHYVTHDAEDGAWQFHPHGGPTPETDAAVVSLREIVERDGSVAALADLPPGWHAWRDTASSPWTRARQGE